MPSPNPVDEAGQDKRQPAPLLVLGDQTRKESTGRNTFKMLTNWNSQREKRATRTKKACITCRRRHVKCDKTWPLCLKCTARGTGLCEGYELNAPTEENRSCNGEEDTPSLQKDGSSDKRPPPGDPVVPKLAEMASLNPGFRQLMRRVADGKAEVQEVITFQQTIDNVQEDLELRERDSQYRRSFLHNLALVAQQNDNSPDKSTAHVISRPSSSRKPISEARANSDAGSLTSRVTWISFLDDDMSNDYSAALDESIRAEGSGNIFVEELSPRPPPPASKQDAPFTDSGYASGLNVGNLLRMELGDDDTSGYDINNLKTRTVYSGDSSVAADQVQQYIFELSSIIHSRLGDNIDEDNWKSFSDHLLGLIKDFAIKLGLESSVRVNRDIMYFIHKRGREIATQLDSMILSVDTSAGNTEESKEAKRDHMLLSDKMALWISKAAETETSINNEFFVGVTDVEETIDAPELSKYNKIVTESNSFKWFIQNLRRELVLRRNVDESEGCNHREILRRQILENLPTGKISKSRPPTIHSVAFRVSEWTFRGVADLDMFGFETLLHETIVVRCCSGDAQAASIEEYMKQTWPSTWKKIFELLQAVSSSTGGTIHADVLHDKTQVSASCEHGNLIMNLEGPAHTIAECGEQLAWLRASCAHTSPHLVMGNTVQQIPVIMSMAALHGRLCFDIGVESPILEESAMLEQSRWRELLRNRNVVFVPGYPILRRPNTFNGIEVSSHYLLKVGSLRRASRSSFALNLVLYGRQRRLSLVKQVQNVYHWHETQSAGNSSCHCSNLGNQDKGAYSGRTIDLESILSSRHIIGQCQESCPGTYNSVPTLEREHRCNDDGCRSPIAPSSSIMEAHGAESPKRIASSGKPAVETRDIEIRSSLAEDDDVDSWASCKYSHGVHPCESTESSLESDLLSMSDSSEEFEKLKDDDPIRTVLDIVVSCLVSGFRCAASGEVPPSGNGQDHGTAASSSSRGITEYSGSTGKGRKRRPVQNDDSDSNEDAAHPRPSKRFKKTQQHIKLLACPFGKMSPSKYSACSRFQLKRIRDVKQHLKRKHTPDDYCNRCLSIFGDEESLTQHMSQPDGFGCQLAPEGRTLDGISHRQSRDLSKKANAELSEEQQWFAIWDIVFPRKSRPESAYLDSAFAMQVCLFREHCARHAEPLLAQNLRAAGLLDERRVAADQEQLLRRVISESLDSVCDAFSTNDSSDSGIGRSHDSTRTETPAASIVDSGIGIGSQMAHSQPRAAFLTAPINPQQNIRPRPTEALPEFRTQISEEVAAPDSQSSITFNQPRLFSQSLAGEFSMNHDVSSTEQRPDEFGTFDFDLTTEYPLIGLSQWDFS